MKKQISSFKHAFCGIWEAVKSETHLRFHLVAGFYVLLFSLFYDFTATQWGLLIVLIALILAFEIANTCMEQICNLITIEYHPLIKLIKDMAAGAVLVMSIGAVAVALLFFWDLSVMLRIFDFFTNNIPLLCLLVLSALCAVIFVVLGPTGIQEKLTNRKGK